MSDTPTPSWSAERRLSPGSHSPFLPVLLGLLAFLGWTVFQTTQMISERSNLNLTHSQQAAALDQAQHIRTAADSLAAKTKELADMGNPDAQLVVAQLRQRGLTINPNAVTPAPPQ